MKILFSNPPWWSKGANQQLRQGRRAGSRWPFTIPAYYKPDQFRFGGYYPFPFFMGYAASYVQKAFPEAAVQFRDSITRGESYNTYKAFLKNWRPEWIFIESATSAWAHDSNLIGYIREWLPSAKIVMAGPISDESANRYLERGVIACIKGEYEKGSVRVLKGETGIIQHDLLLVDEMNAAPIPMVDEACILNYWDSNPIGQKPPHLQMWTSRGCPFKCCFCVWPAIMTGNDPDGSKPRAVRCYTPAYVNAYVREMTERYPFKSIYFDDDTFNLTNPHVVGISAVMAEIGAPWSAMCRADTTTRENWQIMKDSGCFGVKLGFESGSQEVIDKIINKRLNLEKAAETARFLKEIGMTVHGTFTVGLPGETDEQRQQTYDFIRSLPLDSYQLSGTAEIEGTPLFNMKSGVALKAYPGAVKDESYHPSPDGALKAEEMHL